MEKLREYLRDIINKYPELKGQINDLFQLCKDEIEEGGSEDHEIELCYSSVDALVKEIEGK